MSRPNSSVPSQCAADGGCSRSDRFWAMGECVASSGASKALAYTGASSVPMVIIGTVLLLAGATIALVARSRQRQAEA